MIGKKIGLYRIEEKLAQGGSATLYRAVQDGGGAELAVKFVKRSRGDYADQRARMRHEAALSLRVAHSGIVRTFSTGETDEGCYAIQELLRGKPLHRELRERTRPGAGLPRAEALALALDLAAARAALHAAGLVHADLKPPNVMLCRSRAVICDLGLALLEGEVRANGLLMGSPSYMAPEMGPHVPVTRAVDLWALGVVLFEMLAGTRPFGLRDDEPLAILKAVHAAPLSLAWLKDQPREVQELVAELLERDPAKRMWDATTVAMALKALG